MDQETGQLDRSQVFSSGSVISNRYEIVGLLGSGGMGDVYLVKDSLQSNREFAMKVLHGDQMHDETQTQRFLREVELTRKINHKNVVRTFDVGMEKDLIFFTMEYIPGKSLDDLMEDGIKKSQIADIIVQICEGLEAIHNVDILHRDLKPGNIIVLEDGTVKITDFGIARPEVSNLTAHNEIIGSIYYVAPEVWLGKKLTASVDLYSLGILIYELCTGNTPFDGDSPAELMRLHLERAPKPPKEVNPSVPSWLNKLTLRLLKKSRLDRPRNAREIIEFVQMHTGKGAAGAGVNGKSKPPSDFIMHLEEQSQRATRFHESQQDPSKAAGGASAKAVSGAKRSKGLDSLKRCLIVCWRLLLVAIAVSISGLLGLHAMGSLSSFLPITMRISIDSYSFDPSTLSLFSVFKIGFIQGSVFLLIIAVPATLIAAAGNRWALAARSYVAFLLYNLFCIITLLLYNLRPVLQKSYITSASLFDAGRLTYQQLTEIALLSPTATLSPPGQIRGILADLSANALPIMESPVHIVACLIYVFFLSAFVLKAAPEQTRFNPFTAGGFLMVLIVVEATALKILSLLDLPEVVFFGMNLPAVGAYMSIINWVLLYGSVAFVTIDLEKRRTSAVEKIRFRVRKTKSSE